MSGYGALDRLLHRLALFAPIAEFSLDLDRRIAPVDPERIAGQRHVFVSGLARAGTTALMRRFHDTGLFRSLTYRDMPFVLAPNLWQRLQPGTGAGEKTERAHGDGVMVDVDSPESLDEVFWRVVDGDRYIEETALSPHEPDAETVARFRAYVASVLAADPDGPRRYLSKNNNNILRLPAIRRAFPEALLLVPFRHPAAHARSLATQHRNFRKVQAEDPFARRYMGWLVHHEFGLDHRPFRFGTAEIDGHPDDPGYWLARWTDAYRHLEATAPDDAVFVCYEDLCNDETVWRRLAARAELPPDADGGTPFRAAPAPQDDDATDEARALYEKLRARAEAALATD